MIRAILWIGRQIGAVSAGPQTALFMASRPRSPKFDLDFALATYARSEPGSALQARCLVSRQFRCAGRSPGRLPSNAYWVANRSGCTGVIRLME